MWLPQAPTLQHKAGTLNDALSHPEFHYQAEYKVLICKLHGLGIVGLESHLRDKHGLRTKKERRPILDRYAHLELAEPQNIAVPPADGLPFEALRVQGGFCCNDCGHLSTSSKAIQGHCNTEHQWRVSRRDKTHWTEVKIQTFFEGFYLQYFTVVCEPAAAGRSAGTNAAYDELRQKFLRGMEEGREKHTEQKKILDAAMEKIDNTGWWTHTRWQLHFGDRHFGNIAHASRLPDRKERELVDAKTIIISMIKHAVDGLSLLHDDTPNWLRTANATNRVENRPMVRLQNVESLDTYINYWVRFMCYCLRVRAAQRKMEAREERRGARQGSENDTGGASGAESDTSGDNTGSDDREEEDDEGAGSDVAGGSEDIDTERGDRVGAEDQQEEEEDEDVRRFKDCCELAKFTDEQKRLLDEMQESLDTKEGEETQTEKMMALSVSLIFQSIKGLDRFDSAMVHFGAVMGINEEGTNLLLGDRCSFKFAGFIYCIRVLFLEHVLPTSMRREMTARDIDHFLEMRAKYLVVGGYNPTGELIKWLGYGKIMSLQKINQPSITWTRSKENRPDGDILYFHGKPLPIRRFKTAVHDMIGEAEDILWRDLMWTEKKGDRFTIDLARIQDNLADVQRDGSFITNPANDLGGKEAWMFDRMTAAKKSKRLVGRDRTQFSMSKVREYRQMVERLMRLMLVTMHMSGGPPGRGQEITPLRFRNGILQARNFYVVDGRLIFVTRYHKSQAMFGEPKVIPRFIPWRLAQVFAVYLVYVQPWVEELDQQTNGLPRSDHLWHDKNGSFTTYYLTKALREETAIRMGQELTTSGYRHAAVEMGREYVGTDFMLHQPGGDEMLPEGEDVIEGPAALDNAVDLAAAHTQAQAQRYGVRADIIRNLTDESLQVFGSICSRWHDFLGLDSRQPTWMKHGRGPSDIAMETTVKRTAGLTFHPHPMPANRPVMGSQLTDTSMGGSPFVLGSQAASQFSQVSSSPLGQSIPISRATPTPASRLPLSLERSRLVSRLTPVSRLELSMRASSQAPSWTGSTPPPSQWTPTPWPAPSQGPMLSPWPSSGAPTQEPALPPWSSSPAGPASPLARFSASAGALMTPAGSSALAWTPSVNADRGVLPLTAPTVYSVEQVKRAMQTVLNQEEPAFRSEEQERAVAAVLNLDTPLVIVLPTGGGKTLPFMLAASLPDPGVTILVTPFSAVLHDYVKRLELSKVDHVLYWVNYHPHPRRIPDFLLG
jgi:hypothetical protein